MNPAEADSLRESVDAAAPAGSRFTAADVAGILRERGWLEESPPPSPAAGGDGAPLRTLESWMAEAAALLGPHAESREALANLLGLIFHYDAPAILRAPQSHEVLSRVAARAVIRALAHHVLAGKDIDSDRFKETVEALKGELRSRGRELFHPIRLALAGRAGEGELDRVILLLDAAAKLPFAVAVKGTRQRMLEFCAALD